VHNHNADARPIYGSAEKQILSLAAFDEAWNEIRSWPGYAPTPLVGLPGLATELQLGSLYQKDEGKRFGLMSFKALGGAYAVLRLLQQHLLERHGVDNTASAELLSGRHRNAASQVTVAAATDGNHGRSVAWGANMFGCGCKIYLHHHVSDAREREIAKFGADIVRVEGSYDDSVRQCAFDAENSDWKLVADTTAGGGSDVAPKLVMQGYAVLVQEMLDQARQTNSPTHVFVPGGVGGLAAAVAAHLSEGLTTRKPRIIVVEPNEADCILTSIAAGKLANSAGSMDTFMACLSAGEVSPLAWPILRAHVEDVLALPDAAAKDAMRILAQGIAGDRPVVAGESGVAAIAGAIAASLNPGLREKLGLDENSIVVTIGSEGATDADTYERVVGKSADQIEAAA
jgi:diaminopropionate ammonia-lyase